MEDKELINALIKRIAQKDMESLNEKLNGMSFIQAYNALNGFGLDTDVTTYNHKLFSITSRFECYYNNIQATIFSTSNGGCELHEECEVIIDNYVSVAL